MQRTILVLQIVINERLSYDSVVVNDRFYYAINFFPVYKFRFGSKHLDSENKNLQKDELVEKWDGKQTLLNVLPKEVQVSTVSNYALL